MSQASVNPALQIWISEPRKSNACYLTAVELPPQAATTPYGEQGTKNMSNQTHGARLLAPDGWDARERNDFSKSRLLHLPIYRKALNFLNWDIWFSLINNNLSVFKLPAPCWKLLSKLTPPRASLEQLSQGHLRCYLPGWSPKNSQQIKWDFELLGCDYILKFTIPMGGGNWTCDNHFMVYAGQIIMHHSLSLYSTTNLT